MPKNPFRQKILLWRDRKAALRNRISELEQDNVQLNEGIKGRIKELKFV